MALSIGDYIGSYQLTEEFRVAGGRSRISFAEQGGKRWFVKEFLSPKYPTPDSPGSEKTKEYKRKMCETFETQQRKIMQLTRNACSSGSNLICAKELIRKNASYYKISEAVDTQTMQPEEVAQLPLKDILSILKSLCAGIRILHLNKIVHGDLKPENILIKKSEQTGAYYAKLIDFDDSYFSGEPNSDKESVVGTPEYYSPEVYAYITDEDDNIPGTALTCASDIYSLGLLFCEYLTGSRPLFDDKHRYAYMASYSGDILRIPDSPNVNDALLGLITVMLSKDFTKRPTVNTVIDELKRQDAMDSPAEKPMDCRKPTETILTQKEPYDGHPILKLKKKAADCVRKIKSIGEPDILTIDTAPKLKIKTQSSSCPPSSERATCKRADIVSSPKLKIHSSAK